MGNAQEANREEVEEMHMGNLVTEAFVATGTPHYYPIVVPIGIASEGEENEEDGGHRPPGGGAAAVSPCPTEVVDRPLWSSTTPDWNDEQEGSTTSNDNTEDSSPPRDGAEQLETNNAIGNAMDSLGFSGNNNNYSLFLANNGFYGNLLPSMMSMMMGSNIVAAAATPNNNASNAPTAMEYQPQQPIPIYNSNVNNHPLMVMDSSPDRSTVNASNYIGTPLYYTLTDGSGSNNLSGPPPPPPPPPFGGGGPVVPGNVNNGMPLMGNSQEVQGLQNQQPMIFLQQPMIYPQQQSNNVMGLLTPPQQVMVDPYGNGNPRSSWDSLMASGGYGGGRSGNGFNTDQQSEYYTAYAGSCGGGDIHGWNGSGQTVIGIPSSDNSTYYSYTGGSYCSTGELSSNSFSSFLSPAKSLFSTSADTSFGSSASFDSSNGNGVREQNYEPAVAWTQHPTFLVPPQPMQQMFGQNNPQGYSTGNSTGISHDLQAFPVPNCYPGCYFPIVQPQLGAALNTPMNRKPRPRVGASSNSDKNSKGGKGSTVKNKKKSAPVVKAPIVNNVVSYSYAVDCGYTFLMNGTELQFVMNVWDPVITAMLMKMSPAQGYNYYVPPCVNDGDFFGGQLPLWQFRMIHYFDRFRPDLWRIQAVPDINRSVADGWFCFDVVSKLRYCCRSCKMPWTTKKGRMTFFFKRNPDNKIGYIYLKMFRQICMKTDCPDRTAQTPACYPEEIERAVCKLSELISSLYYGAPLNPGLFTECSHSIRVTPSMPRAKSSSSSPKKKRQDKVVNVK